jgi:dTDP-4-dehydrorhamnose 3,5-epimerase
MQVTSIALEGVRVVHLRIFSDNRGFFVERFNEARFQDDGLPVRFCQDNHSRSAPNVVRGLHYQHGPGQGKLVGVVRGAICDVVVDIRHGSPTYGQHHVQEISDRNGVLLWIPPGFAHGFCVVGDEPADVLYKVDTPYNPQREGGILWNDPQLNIAWPVKQPIINGKDTELQSWSDYARSPVF